MGIFPEPMKDASESEQEDDLVLSVPLRAAASTTARESRSAREEKLRKMMEEDSDDEPEGPFRFPQPPFPSPAHYSAFHLPSAS